MTISELLKKLSVIESPDKTTVNFFVASDTAPKSVSLIAVTNRKTKNGAQIALTLLKAEHLRRTKPSFGAVPC